MSLNAPKAADDVAEALLGGIELPVHGSAGNRSDAPPLLRPLSFSASPSTVRASRHPLRVLPAGPHRVQSAANGLVRLLTLDATSTRAKRVGFAAFCMLVSVSAISDIYFLVMNNDAGNQCAHGGHALIQYQQNISTATGTLSCVCLGTCKGPCQNNEMYNCDGGPACSTMGCSSTATGTDVRRGDCSHRYITQDSGYNWFVLPLHLLPIYECWFLRSRKTAKHWAYLRTHQRYTKRHCRMYICIAVLTLTAMVTYFLKFTNLPYPFCGGSWPHICGSEYAFYTPVLGWEFSNGYQNPPFPVVLLSLAEMGMHISACASAIIVATIDIETQLAQEHFLGILAQQVLLNRLEVAPAAETQIYRFPVQPVHGPPMLYAELHQEFSKLIRAKVNTVTILRTMLKASLFVVMLVPSIFVLVYVHRWDRCLSPYCNLGSPQAGGIRYTNGAYRLTLTMLMIPKLFLPTYCVLLGARMNSHSTFLTKITELDSYGCFGHLECDQAIALFNKITQAPMPQVTVAGLSLNARTLKGFGALLTVLYTGYARM
jgi:hypothetical protein